MLAVRGVDRHQRFFAGLEAVLEVLPPPRMFAEIKLDGDVAEAASDFQALYEVFRVAYRKQMDEAEC